MTDYEMERRRIYRLNYHVHNIVSCIALVVALTFSCMQAEAKEEREIKDCDFTCYIDSGTCFTGCQTRRGIAASSEALIGYTAVVWTTDGEFIGYFEILDKIGTKWGRSGTLDEPHVIDIWCEDMDEAKRLMELTEGKCKVMLIKAEG